MNDPTRWRDGAEDLPDDVRASLRAAKGPVRPDAADRAAIVAMATQIAAAPPAADPSASHVITKAAGWKAAGLAGLVVIGVASVHIATRARHLPTTTHTVRRAAQDELAAPETSARPANESTVPVVAPPETQPPSNTAIVAPPADRANAAPVPRTTVTNEPRIASRCPATASASESDVLDAAMHAMASDPTITLACLRLLETRAHGIALRDEYRFLGFEASRRLGRTADARRWAQQLLDDAPDSPYAARVRRWMQGAPGE